MLEITIPGGERWSDRENRFYYPKETTIRLEHSLVSLSKWEAKWEIPFIGNRNLTYEQNCDYVQCMNMTQNVSSEVFEFIPPETLAEIRQYVDKKMTATTISNTTGRKSRETVTSEVIYCWMTELGIPFECQKWHLNRLITFIQVCQIRKAPQKKYRGSDLLRRNYELNELRKKQWGSNG